MNTSKLRHLPSLLAFALLAVTAQWMLTQPISAQETDTTEEAVVEDINGGEKSIIDMFRAGGWAMYPLTLLSIGGFGLIVYNFMAVRPEPILNTSATVQIDKALEELDIEIREHFIKHGGQELVVVNCLNDDPNWIRGLVHLVENAFSKTMSTS